MGLSSKKKEMFAGYGFLAPNMIGFLCFTSLPVLASLLLGFTYWDLTSKPVFAGLDNFKNLLGFSRSVEEPFAGMIDDVSIFNKALGQKQILEVMEQGPNTYDQELVAYYSFDYGIDDTAICNDLSGNQNNGKIYGSIKSAEGVRSEYLFDKALVFNGFDSYVHINDSKDINLGIHQGRTICLWFNVREKSKAYNKQVIYKEGGTDSGINVYIDNGILYAGGWNIKKSESGWEGTYIKTADIENGKWHHVAVTLFGDKDIQDGAFSLFIDGSLIGSGRGSQLWSHKGNILLGANLDGTRFHDEEHPGGKIEPNDADFWKYVGNTIFFMLGIPITMAASLFLAVILNKKIRGISVFRTIYFMPTLAAGVAIYILWRWIFNQEYGLLNSILGWIGIQGPGWLTNRMWAKPSLIMMGIWMNMGGYNMILYLAGLQGIPLDLYEAADIDGATAWQKFCHITWPMLSPTTFFISIMSVIAGFQGGFDAAYIMTGGGPAGATTTISFYIYRNAYEWFHFGYAASISWVLFLVVFCVTLFNWKFGGKVVHYQ